MKRAFIIVSMILFILLPTGCAQKVDREEDFGFRLSYGVNSKNKLDTFNGTFTKDLVTAGTKTGKLSLTDDEIKEILDELIEMDIINYPKNFTQYYSITPTSNFIFYIKIGEQVKELRWETGNIPLKSIDPSTNKVEYIETEETEDILKLSKLIEKIIKMVEEKQEYKDMPEAEGGYL